MNFLNKLGKKVPEYDLTEPQSVSMKIVVQYAINRMQQYVGRHKSLWSLIRIIKLSNP